MGKNKISREVTDREVNCLENLVVAYNSLFLVSSIVIISIAGTAKELFSEINRLLSPSLLLLIVGAFIVIVAFIGFIGIAKRSSFLISMYTLLLIYVFVLEIAGGIGILSFRKEIKTMAVSKMTKSITAYPEDPMTANLVDYVQLQLQCCGIMTHKDWDKINSNAFIGSKCKVSGQTLPQSCCTKVNSTLFEPNKRGCLPTVNYILHRSSFLLSSTIVAICTIQILGAYFAYTLSSTINKYKIQQLMRASTPSQRQEYPYSNTNEKVHHL